MLRACFLAAVAGLLLLAACGGGGGNDDEDSDPTKALKAALAYAGDDPHDVPPLDQNYDCVINPARQPSPPQSPLLPVHGSCLWSVAPEGTLWLVTFHETWFCSDWAADVPGYPACDSITGNHEWKYLVDLAQGTVSLDSHRGQFAPDM
jgi:hypothetical protein